MHMVIFCEECGEKYILPQHLSGIPAEFQCQKCQDIFNIPQSPLESSPAEQIDEAEGESQREVITLPHNFLQSGDRP